MHVAWLLVLGSLALGCKSPQELGREAAEKKLGFVEGMADGLKDKGAVVGRKSVEGVGEVVKGVGGATKDQTTPLVAVKLDDSIDKATLVVRQAHAYLAAADRKVVLECSCPKRFEGGLQLVVLGEGDAEMGRSKPIGHATVLAGLDRSFEFFVPNELHLTQAKSYLLRQLPPKTFTTKDLPKVTLSQLQQQGEHVSLYVQFAAKFAGALELRAFDADGQEIARSAATPVLAQAADSSITQDFTFPATAPMGAVTRFEVAKANVVKPAK